MSAKRKRDSAQPKMRRSVHMKAHLPIVILVLLSIAEAAQQKPEKNNMDLVGYNDLQVRSAYQPTIHKQGDRLIAYVGHHGGLQMNPLTGKQENNGTSIVDVTDPKQPRYIAHIPGEAQTPGPGESGGAQMTRVCDGSQLPRADKSKVYLLRSLGNSAHEVWDVTDPAKPNRVTVVVSGTAGHSQKFLGMRHRNCVPRLRRARMADASHDSDLRLERSLRARFYP
jgi:hypothetical protein